MQAERDILHQRVESISKNQKTIRAIRRRYRRSGPALGCDETEWVNSYVSVLDKQFKEACLSGVDEYEKEILKSQLEELYDLDMHSEKAQIQIEQKISEIIEE